MITINALLVPSRILVLNHSSPSRRHVSLSYWSAAIATSYLQSLNCHRQRHVAASDWPAAMTWNIGLNSLEETDAFLSLDDSIPPSIDNGIYDPEGYILFLEELLKDEILRDLPPKVLKDDEPRTTKSLIEKPPGIDKPSKTERSEIYTLIGEPPDTFLMGDEEIKFNPFKNIDDPVPIPRVFKTTLDSFDSSLDIFYTTFTNPLFELDSEYTLNYDNLIFDIQNDENVM
ncbi:hypothetical protein Tco_0479316 [Tanacetum coccineum]